MERLNKWVVSTIVAAGALGAAAFVLLDHSKPAQAADVIKPIEALSLSKDQICEILEQLASELQEHYHMFA
jgi:hypothetical protein